MHIKYERVAKRRIFIILGEIIIMKPKIKERRMEKHLNQKQFAKKLGVPQDTLSKWETGKITPSLKYLYRMEELLQCTLKDLFE